MGMVEGLPCLWVELPILRGVTGGVAPRGQYRRGRTNAPNGVRVKLTAKNL